MLVDWGCWFGREFPYQAYLPAGQQDPNVEGLTGEDDPTGEFGDLQQRIKGLGHELGDVVGVSLPEGIRYCISINIELFQNPLAEEPYYRLRVIHKLPYIVLLDRHIVTGEE